MANFIGGWRDTFAQQDYCIGQTEGVITTEITSIPQILYIYVVVPDPPNANQLFIQFAMGYKNNILSLFAVDGLGSNDFNQVTTALNGDALGTATSPTTATINFTDGQTPPTTLLQLQLDTNNVVDCGLQRIPNPPPQP